MSTMAPLLIKLSILTLFLLHSVASSYQSNSSPSPSPSSSPSPLHESPLTPSPSPSPSPTHSYSPPAPPSHSHSPTSESAPVPAQTPGDDDTDTPTPPPVSEGVTNDKTMNIVTQEAKKRSSGGSGVGLAFGLIGAACLVIFGGSVYKKRRDNIRRSRRYSAANIQLI